MSSSKVKIIFTLVNLVILSFVVYQLFYTDKSNSKKNIYTTQPSLSQNSKNQNLIEVKRWYTPEQVNLGEKIYQRNCMICHQSRGSGSPNWQQPLANGSYPPPPLNGTAHTWHHSKEVLFNTIKKGSENRSMPSFEKILPEEQIYSVVAYFQSLWPESIYQEWLKRNP